MSPIAYIFYKMKRKCQNLALFGVRVMVGFRFGVRVGVGVRRRVGFGREKYIFFVTSIVIKLTNHFVSLITIEEPQSSSTKSPKFGVGTCLGLLMKNQVAPCL